jgi:hypothetical protein
MSAEDVREHVDRALEQAVAGRVETDELEAIFEEALDRVEGLREVRGET